jgi:hypothetical protein
MLRKLVFGLTCSLFSAHLYAMDSQVSDDAKSNSGGGDDFSNKGFSGV